MDLASFLAFAIKGGRERIVNTKWHFGLKIWATPVGVCNGNKNKVLEMEWYRGSGCEQHRYVIVFGASFKGFSGRGSISTAQPWRAV